MKIKKDGELKRVKRIKTHIIKHNKDALAVMIKESGQWRLGWVDETTPPRVIGIQNIEGI